MKKPSAENLRLLLYDDDPARRREALYKILSERVISLLPDLREYANAEPIEELALLSVQVCLALEKDKPNPERENKLVHILETVPNLASFDQADWDYLAQQGPRYLLLEVLAAMGRRPPYEALQTLEICLQHPDATVRQATVLPALFSNDMAVVSHCLALLNDPCEAVAEEVFKQLRQCTGTELALLFDRGLRVQDKGILQFFAGFLPLIVREELRPLCMRLQQSSDPALKSAASRGLEELNRKKQQPEETPAPAMAESEGVPVDSVASGSANAPSEAESVVEIESPAALQLKMPEMEIPNPELDPLIMPKPITIPDFGALFRALPPAPPPPPPPPPPPAFLLASAIPPKPPEKPFLELIPDPIPVAAPGKKAPPAAPETPRAKPPVRSPAPEAQAAPAATIGLKTEPWQATPVPPVPAATPDSSPVPQAPVATRPPPKERVIKLRGKLKTADSPGSTSSESAATTSAGPIPGMPPIESVPAPGRQTHATTTPPPPPPTEPGPQQPIPRQPVPSGQVFTQPTPVDDDISFAIVEESTAANAPSVQSTTSSPTQIIPQGKTPAAAPETSSIQAPVPPVDVANKPTAPVSAPAAAVSPAKPVQAAQAAAAPNVVAGAATAAQKVASSPTATTAGAGSAAAPVAAAAPQKPIAVPAQPPTPQTPPAAAPAAAAPVPSTPKAAPAAVPAATAPASAPAAADAGRTGQITVPQTKLSETILSRYPSFLAGPLSRLYQPASVQEHLNSLKSVVENLTGYFLLCFLQSYLFFVDRKPKIDQAVKEALKIHLRGPDALRRLNILALAMREQERDSFFSFVLAKVITEPNDQNPMFALKDLVQFLNEPPPDAAEQLNGAVDTCVNALAAVKSILSNKLVFKTPPGSREPFFDLTGPTAGPLASGSRPTLDLPSGEIIVLSRDRSEALGLFPYFRFDGKQVEFVQPSPQDFKTLLERLELSLD